MKNGLTNDVSPEIQKLFNYVIEKDLNKNFNLSIIEKEAMAYFGANYSFLSDREKRFILKTLENFSFRDNLNNDNFSLSYTLSQFKSKLIKRLTTKKEMTVLKRLVCPPIEAYDYIGTNNLGIIPSERDYGFIFE